MIDHVQDTLYVEAVLAKNLLISPELTKFLAAVEKDSFQREPKMAVAFWKDLSAKLAHVGGGDADFLKSKIDPLLVNNLVLDRTNDGPGEGCYKHCFLCVEIAGEKMPWDATAVDW